MESASNSTRTEAHAVAPPADQALETPRPIPFLARLALVAMCLPIVVLSQSGVEITPADLAAPLVLLFLILGPKADHAPWRGLNVALTFCLVSVAVAFASMLIVDSGTTELTFTYQLGALLFTYRPYIFLIIGALMASRRWDSSQVIGTMGTVAAFVTISVAVPLILGGTPHHQYGPVTYAGRMEFGEHLGGSLFGLPLYARYGVNSLAETYAIYGTLAVAALVYRFSQRRQKTLGDGAAIIWLTGGCVAAAYLCVTSGSRQAELALACVLGGVLLVATLMKVVRATYPAAVVITLALAVLGIAYGARGVLVDIASSGGLDSFAAGRISIFQQASTVISEHFLLGRGFSDSGAQGINAHNLLLNLALKLGLLGLIGYLGGILKFTAPAVRRLFRGVRTPAILVTDLGWVVLLVVVGAVSNSLDVITASGPLLLLLGLHASQADMTQELNADATQA